ncbi:hypothetical protein VNO78_24044 [Psophocarpus tetragonolobus]|uniref:Secreted protein n=1 Tax=Psophocarpus tetragonolobus TaxID=3891 RepID=A0AAN9S7T7_PSOTE
MDEVLLFFFLSFFGLTLCPSVPICSNKNTLFRASFGFLANLTCLKSLNSAQLKKREAFSMGLRERGKTLLSSLFAVQLLQVED